MHESPDRRQNSTHSVRAIEHLGHFPERRIAAIKPDTRVLQVDGDISSEIGLTVGKPAPMALMLRPQTENYLVDIPVQGTLGVTTDHRRSADLLRFTRLQNIPHTTYGEPEDISRGRLFVTYVDVRGSGTSEDVNGIPTGWRYNDRVGRIYEGLGWYKQALKDWNITQKFRKLGCLLHVPVAIIEARELPILKDKTIRLAPIQEADTKKIMRGDKRPVFFLRGYLCKSRMHDLINLAKPNLGHPSSQRELVRKEISAVLETLSQYQGHPMDISTYLVWYTRRLAKTFGIFHREKYLFVGAGAHNFTLAGEVVDTDMMTYDPPRLFDTHAAKKRRLNRYAFELKGLSDSEHGVLNQIYALHRTLAFAYPDEQLPQRTDLEKIFAEEYVVHNTIRGREILQITPRL